MQSDLICQFLNPENHYTINADLLAHYGPVVAVTLTDMLYYMQENSIDGWFTITNAEHKARINVTTRQLQDSRDILMQDKILQIRKTDTFPSKTQYKLDLEVLMFRLHDSMCNKPLHEEVCSLNREVCMLHDSMCNKPLHEEVCSLNNKSEIKRIKKLSEINTSNDYIHTESCSINTSIPHSSDNIYISTNNKEKEKSIVRKKPEVEEVSNLACWLTMTQEVALMLPHEWTEDLPFTKQLDTFFTIRLETNKPFPRSSYAALAEKLRQFPFNTVVKAFQITISNGWGSVFPEKVYDKLGPKRLGYTGEYADYPAEEFEGPGRVT